MDTITPHYTPYRITGGTNGSSVVQLDLEFKQETPDIVRATGRARITDAANPEVLVHTYLTGYSFPQDPPGTYRLSGTPEFTGSIPDNNPMNLPNCEMELVFAADRLAGTANYSYRCEQNKGNRIENARIVMDPDTWNK